MWQTYHQVTAIDEALNLLDQHGENARIMAGGTDLILELERGQRHADVMIDITRLDDLHHITSENGVITLGALVTHNQVVTDDHIIAHALPLAQASWEVGAPQIRNRATVAGNIITASPANDTITPLMALGAWVTLASTSEKRDVPISEFYTGYRKTVMRPDELLTHIHIPTMPTSARGIFIKLGLRKAQAISVLNVAVILDFAPDETITNAVITMGCVAPTIIRLDDPAQALIGGKLTPESIRQTALDCAKIPQPIDDVRAPADYRREMIGVLVARALRALASNTQADSYPQNPAMLWGNHPNGITLGVAHTTSAQNTHIETTINGKNYQFDSGHDKTLLRFLREDAKLIGTKEGCAEGECGACTVFLDGAAVMSCMVGAPRAHGAEIITVEGLSNGEDLHPIQSTFIEKGAVQCGYCTPGLIMSGAKLLEEHPNPTREQALQSISGNLCRCTGYYSIIEAILSASNHKKEVSL
ncbi:MAG: FAD binding domain-containing protein [Anaerolineae bacterium]|nr:FAD binding domain-containing protein [Anaerolineae bacterium]